LSKDYRNDVRMRSIAERRSLERGSSFFAVALRRAQDDGANFATRAPFVVSLDRSRFDKLSVTEQ